MHITLTKDYSVKADTTLLGYQGETNSRKITFSGLVVDGCDLYKLQILYSDGKVYELPIQDEVVTITGSILREIGYVSCQLLGYSVSGSDYTIVFKSNIFELEIKEAIDGEVAPIPPYEESVGALEKVLAGVEAAKGYAESAETAADSAETARQQAVTAQNAAKISADIASSAAQQTTADKNATAGYANTAKTNADSTAADRQAVQTLAEQVETDKANVSENAAKVAEDRTAAETAAQTAQAVADSLPEDYVTAVEKIAKNTADIASIKLVDKEMKRRVDALYDIGQGITHKFETDSSTAYAKTIPTGSRLMSVKNIGGRSIVWNQLVDSNIDIIDTTRYSFNGQHLKTNVTDNLSLSDDICTLPTIPVGHKVLLKIKFIAGNVGGKTVTIGGYHNTANTSWQCKIDLPINTELAGKTLIAMDTTTDTAENIKLFLFNGTIPLLTNIDCYINYYDLTVMFGSGNEPSTVEEFEAMFPADYYPYNAGEIVSAGTESIIEQGKNLFDENAPSEKLFYDEDNNVIVASGSWNTKFMECPQIAKNLTVKVPPTKKYNDKIYTFFSRGKSIGDDVISYKYVPFYKNTESVETISIPSGARYFAISLWHGISFFRDIQIELGDTATAYAPYHRNVYPIPEAIRNLPGYGVEGNVTDYEAKTYTQNNTVDGTEIKALDTPIITDISNLIPDDFLRNIEVEAGGIITFKNSNDNYRIPVPSEEEYVVKLSEVGGTT